MVAMRHTHHSSSSGQSINHMVDSHMGRAMLLCAATLSASAVFPASARQCEVTNWQGGYESSIGVDRVPSATAVLDHDGDGVPTLFAASPGGAMGGTAIRGLARWTGTAWEPFGPGFSGSVVRILMHDLDGDGSASLVLAGLIQFEDGGPRRELVAWNGSAWTVVSDAPANGPYLKDAASVDVDGDGVATLFATREVVYPAADTTALVRREAGAWIPVDPAQTVSLTGSGNQTGRLAAHDDDGDGVPSLYASVVVGDPGGFVAIGLARFDGKVLGPVSAEANPPLVGGRIESMASGDFDADGIRDLVVAGRVAAFPAPAGASGIVVLENGAWSVPGSVFTLPTGSVESVAAVNDVVYADDDGDGSPSLFATGYFTKAGAAPMSRIARLELSGGGAEWAPLGAGLSGGGLMLEAVPRAKSGADLVAFGSFTTAGSSYARGSARWNGGDWSALGAMAPTLGVDSVVLDSVLFDHDGDGSKSVVAAGQFRYAGMSETRGVALFDGSQWASLGGLPSWTGGGTAALAADLDGDGVETLYVAGTDGASFHGVAAFVPDGAGGSWVQLGANLTQRIETMVVADHDGDGVADLFAAGRTGTSAAPTVLRWTGSAWAALAGSLAGADSVNDLVAFDDDGDGRASLFAAAGRSDPNFIVNRVRKWTAGTWSNVGAITQGHVFRLQAFDHDGDGVESLVAFGQFLTNNAYPLTLMMTLSGTAWTPFGPTTSVPYSAGCWLARFDDDGDGTAGVFFSIYDPFAARYGRLLRIDGASSATIASDMGYGMVTRHELDLDRDGARSLLMLGLTEARPGAFGSGLGEIEQCIAPCIADLDGDGTVGSRDITVVLAAWGACGSGACAADLDGSGEVGAGDIAILVAAWGGCP
ncbi:MAG: hypothetical protein RL325_1501 [Planctomycetota bacterium]